MLVQDALRLIAYKAIKGEPGKPKTWAGDRVFDSPAQPADLKIKEERLPFISVYTDDADIDLDRQSLPDSDNKAFLLIECAFAEGIAVKPAEPGSGATGAPAGSTIIRISQTDEALELGIGVLARQATQALNATDNEWAELFRLLTSTGRHRIEVRRGGTGQQEQQPAAVRFASRILRMQVSLLGEPVYGEGVTDEFWRRFIEACGKDEELSEVAPLFRAQFETDPLLPSWRIEQKYGTYTRRGLAALGIAPPRNLWSDEAEPPPLKDVEVDPLGGTVEGGDGTIFREGRRP